MDVEGIYPGEDVGDWGGGRQMKDMFKFLKGFHV